MKRILSSSLLAAVSVAVISCDQSKEDTSAIEQRLEELERGKIEDQKRQQALEQELADQKIAREWEAIERERSLIAEAKAHLEAQTQTNAQTDVLALAELEALRLRDEELAAREARAALTQADLIEERSRLASEKLKLDEQALALAGREAGPFAQARDAEIDTVDYQFFNNALSPYGSWYETAEYGSVWQPAACSDPTWRPYSRGHWVCSDRGWTWVSSEPFGWATYHYGRWALLQDRRWIWVPGSEWAPSWCTWRSGDSHIGWAPLPPETLAYTHHAWDSRVESQYGIGASSFNFVDIGNFGNSISSYCLPVAQNTSFFQITTNITNIEIVNQQIFSGGPSYRSLSKRLKRPIPYYQIERSRDSYDRPNQPNLRSQVRGDKLIVAAPRIERNEREIIRPDRNQAAVMDARVERTATADPEALKAYRNVRERELTQALTPPVTRTDTPPTVRPTRDRDPSVTEALPIPEKTVRPGIPVRPAPRPRIAEAEKVERPTIERERLKPGTNSRPSRLPIEREQADEGDLLAHQAQLQRNELQRQEEMRQQNETARRQMIENDARKKQAEDLRRQTEAARAEQVRREADMRDEAQQKLREAAQQKQQENMREETGRRDRATAEARQQEERKVKEQQDAAQKQRDELRQKAEGAPRKLEQAAQQKQQESMREETGRRDRATAEARQQAERQVKEQQETLQKQRDDLRQKTEAARQKLEQAAQEKQQENMSKERETGRRDRATAEARQQAERQVKEQQDAARKQQDAARQQAEAARKEQADQEARKQKEEQELRRKQEEAERAQKAEEQRKQMEEAKRQQEEARRKQQEEAERAQKAEEQRKQMEEARRQQEEQRRQQEEAQRQQQEEQRRQQEEAQRKQQEEAQRRQQEEAQRQQQEEQRRQQEEAQRKQQQQQ